MSYQKCDKGANKLRFMAHKIRFTWFAISKNFVPHSATLNLSNKVSLFYSAGDLGQTYDSKQTFEHYLSNPKGQAMVFVGDLSYADNHPFHDNRKWDAWGRFVEKSTAYQPWIWTAGNHELDLAPEIVSLLSNTIIFYSPEQQNKERKKNNNNKKQARTRYIEVRFLGLLSLITAIKLHKLHVLMA